MPVDPAKQTTRQWWLGRNEPATPPKPKQQRKRDNDGEWVAPTAVPRRRWWQRRNPPFEVGIPDSPRSSGAAPQTKRQRKQPMSPGGSGGTAKKRPVPAVPDDIDECGFYSPPPDRDPKPDSASAVPDDIDECGFYTGPPPGPAPSQTLKIRSEPVTSSAQPVTNPYVHMIDVSTPATKIATLREASDAARVSAAKYDETADAWRVQAAALDSKAGMAGAADAARAEAARCAEVADDRRGMAAAYEECAAEVAAS